MFVEDPGQNLFGRMKRRLDRLPEMTFLPASFKDGIRTADFVWRQLSYLDLAP
jgi:hypothetical protein